MKFDAFSDGLPSEEKLIFYEKLLSQIQDLIFQVTISMEGKIKFSFLSRSIISYFELTKNEIRKDAFEVLKNKIPAEDFEGFIKSIDESKNYLDSWVHEFIVKFPKKGLRWFKGVATIERAQNGDVLFLGRLIDISDRKEQEKTLMVSEERYQFVLKNASKGIWDLNLKTDKVLISSQSMKMLDFEEQDKVYLRHRWDDRIHPDDKENYLRDIKMHMDKETPIFENVRRMLSKDGSYKWILSRGKIIGWDSNGKPKRAIGTHTDITILKEKEIELERTHKIISEQNSRLLNFAHIVSHNLRSHVGNFEMLLQIIDNEKDEEVIKQSYSHLKSTSNALTETIGHLKELVDIQNGLVHKSENLDLNYYLNQTLKILHNEVTKSQAIVINKIPEKSCVFFNPAYLESVFLNFITNAIKYSSPDRKPEIKFTFLVVNGVKTLEISDNGLGIDLKMHRDKLFGMYKTFHKHPNARGIGLFITKNQIEAMNATLEVESEVGVGTRFKILFNGEV